MENTRGWLLTIGILVILGAAAYGLIWTVRDTIQQSVSPVQDITGNVGTRIAQLLNPTPTVLPDPVTIIHEVRSLARLETIQYSVEKVIAAETNQGPFGFLFGDRLLLVTHGVVVAGVDLQKLRPEDLQLKNGVLQVRLPAAEIFITALDNDKSYVYDRETGLLTHGDIRLETTARQAAEDEIEKAALEDGILKGAQINAENYLMRLFQSLGYEDVIFLKPE